MCFTFFTSISYESSYSRSFSICSTMGPKNFEIALIFFEPLFYLSRDIFHSFECEDHQNVMNSMADISNITSERSKDFTPLYSSKMKGRVKYSYIHTMYYCAFLTYDAGGF